MEANKRTDTGPERALRSALHAKGFRYRKDRPIPVQGGVVRPDIVFSGTRLAIFVDGCFWHACPVHWTQSKSNTEFWDEKARQNKARDRRQTEDLESAGWRVVRIWEHEDLDVAVAMVESAIYLGI